MIWRLWWGTSVLRLVMTTKTMTWPWEEKDVAHMRMERDCSNSVQQMTWCSPNGRDRNQIDHLMINGMWRRLLLEVRVKRGADVGSNHHLVIAALKLRRIRPKKKKTSRTPTVWCGESRWESIPEWRTLLFYSGKTDSRLWWQYGLKQPDPDEVNNKWEQVKAVYFETNKSMPGNKTKE